MYRCTRRSRSTSTRELLIRVSRLYWNSLPFGEFLWIRMGSHLRIYKDSPNRTEFQGMNRTPFFDPRKGVPYQRLSPQSGSDGTGTIVAPATVPGGDSPLLLPEVDLV